MSEGPLAGVKVIELTLWMLGSAGGRDAGRPGGGRGEDRESTAAGQRPESPIERGVRHDPGGRAVVDVRGDEPQQARHGAGPVHGSGESGAAGARARRGCRAGELSAGGARSARRRLRAAEGDSPQADLCIGVRARVRGAGRGAASAGSGGAGAVGVDVDARGSAGRAELAQPGAGGFYGGEYAGLRGGGGAGGRGIAQGLGRRWRYRT